MAHELKNELIAMLPRLRRFALTLTRSPAEADDLVQETCLRAIDKTEQWNAALPLDRWVFRIMRNLWISEIRKQKVRIGEGQVPADETNELVNHQTGEDALIETQLKGQISSLPSELSTVLLAVSVEGYTYAEASDLFEIPIGTVMSRIHRARKLLVQQLSAAQGAPS